jgi:hypothetical protein
LRKIPHTLLERVGKITWRLLHVGPHLRLIRIFRVLSSGHGLERI